jgi:molecular chaperone HscA
MAELRAALDSPDHLYIKRAISALNESTVSFAQLRMDKSVSRALAGKNISELEIKQ